MKKAAVLFILSLLFFSGRVFAESFSFTVVPEKYVAGEETLYLQGVASPESRVTISLQKGERAVKEWQVLSDESGEWFFSTRELIGSGEYDLLAQEEGSGFSDRRQLEVSLSGFSLGPYPVAFKDLVLSLALVLAAVLVFALYFVAGTWRLKKVLRKEIREARLTLLSSFETLDQEMEEEIKSFDLRPGFNPREKEIYEELKKTLVSSRNSIEKEIRDIEEAL